MEIGETTFYNFGGVSGSSQQLGNTEFCNFSNGANATRQEIGGFNFCSGNTPSLNGTTQSIGGAIFGNWENGTEFLAVQFVNAL